MRSVVPPSVELFLLIGRYAEAIEPVFDPNQDIFKVLKDSLRYETAFNNAPYVQNNPMLIIYLQLLLLLALTMYGGVFVPELKRLNLEDNGVTLQWSNGVRDRFTFGLFDDTFCKFYRSVYTRLFVRLEQQRSKGKTVPTTLVFWVAQILRDYAQTLALVEKRVVSIYEQEESLVRVFQNELQPDLLFLIIAAFPSEQINAMLLYIRQFFPQELVVKLKSGNRVNVNALWQTPSPDIRYLLEKVDLYFDLYFTSEQPIIRHITQLKTRDYVTSMLENPAVLQVVLTNLKELHANQIQVRQTMYQFFLTHLDRLIAHAP
ncbi:MAG: hypothetical protein AB7F28_07215 [Candidatus Margulisiibacteriota bacterium]